VHAFLSPLSNFARAVGIDIDLIEGTLRAVRLSVGLSTCVVADLYHSRLNNTWQARSHTGTWLLPPV